MQAHRLILETNQYGHLIQQPQLPANAKLEAIFLLLEEKTSQTFQKHQPSARLSQLYLKNDENLFEPIISDAEMDVFMERTAQQIAGVEEAFK